MGRISVAVLFAFTFCFMCFAQEPLPPPPPLIYAPPDVGEIKELVASECGYAISFAGSIEVRKKPNDPEFGCSGLSHSRKGSLATFRMIRFSKDDLAKHPPEEVFSMIKEAYRFKSRNESSSEKEIKVDGIDGKEFSFSDNIRYRRVLAFIKDRTLYELYIDVTNWHILNAHHPEIAAAFEREADRFFKSFRFLNR